MPWPTADLVRQLQPLALPIVTLPLAALGLGFTPSPLLAPTLLMVLLLQLQRTSVSARSVVLAFASLVPGLTLAYLSEITKALRAHSQAVVSVGLLSCLLSAVALGTIACALWVAARPVLAERPVARLLTFPVLWTTAWAVFGRLSPLGRQGAWTPLNGFLFDSNVLLIPFLGSSAVDFTLALSSALVAQALGDRQNLHGAAGQGDNDHLNRYLAESRQLVSSATVLLWPEGVVSLSTEKQWDEMVREVGAVASQSGSWIGVGVIAPYGRVQDDEGRELRKNALVLVGPDGKVVGEYHKQNRVPIAESFSIAAHPQVPPTFTLPLPIPHGVAKTNWSMPELDYKRPAHLTSVICNDLNFPDLFTTARTSLTLVPSSTWSLAVGFSLLAQARARALETAAPILLCDAGAAGVSAFVDAGGHVLQQQVGGGSFVAHAKLDVQPGFGMRRHGTGFQQLGEGGVAALLLALWALLALMEGRLRQTQGVNGWQEAAEDLTAGWQRVRGLFGGRTAEVQLV